MYLLVVLFIIFYVLFDGSYFIRTLFTIWSGRVYQRKYRVDEVTTIYGICTLLDCDLWFRHIRTARLVRELDFARFHFYDRTGIYHRAKLLKLHSLQGSTLTYCDDPVPLFAIYRIDSKVIYWDERSMFFEHKVTTVNDGKVRHILISRQFSIGIKDNPVKALLSGIPGADQKPCCPEVISNWMDSMELSSRKLRSA